MLPTDLPELAVVIVMTNGGPYAAGDAVSVAFTRPTVGRLVAHAPTLSHEGEPHATLFPETISARIVHAAPPYEIGDVITLSFVEPRIARIHLVTDRRLPTHPSQDQAPTVRFAAPTAARASDDDLPTSERDWEVAGPKSGDSPRDEHLESLPPPDGQRLTIDSITDARDLSSLRPAEHAVERASPTARDTRDEGVRFRLRWDPDRARRFVRVVDKLFTVDRLGWYRHAFAMRLLVPDEIWCGDPVANVEAMRHLVALRAAAVETLGRPLLAAFMPNFSVTSDWLETLDNPTAAQAISGLRDAIAPHVRNVTTPQPSDDPSVTTGSVDRRSFEAAPASTIESLLPIFIASDSKNAELAARLDAYRRSLCEVFAQTATSVDAVRLNGMTQPNHSLDDRLWQLVGVVGVTLDGLAVA